MKISEATIEALRQAVKEDYGKDLDLSEASEILYTMVGYFDLLAKIRHREAIENNYDNNTTN